MKARLLRGGLLAGVLSAGLVLSTGSVPGGQSVSAAEPRYHIEWAPCPGSEITQCGTLQVPADWSRPRGQKIDIAVARRAAEDPDRRIGTLFFNPGGPGDGGVANVIAAEIYFSDTLRARFDIVSVDPRGIGNSTPIRCGVPALTPETTFFPRTQQQFDAMLDHSRELAQSCLRMTGPLFLHADTVSVARDHEALRIALGVRKVNWLGLSYGTQLAANYADLYPNRTRAMVLDAALEHSLPEVAQAADAISTVEEAFNRFADWCDTAAECVLQGQDVRAVYDDLVESANENPIPVEGALRPVTGDDIRMISPMWLASKEPNHPLAGDFTWAGFAEGIRRAAAEGDASFFAFPPPQGPTDFLFGRAANACGDYVSDIHTYADMQQRMEMGRQLAPHLQGGSETWWYVLCAGWPFEPANPQQRLDVKGVPTLIVHANHDPSVSYKWAFGLAAQIRDSSVLTRVGDGHTSYYTSDCAPTAMDSYLVRPQSPPAPVCTS
jgi:pimeloyl-ACP methyl ester carboxylesterase